MTDFIQRLAVSCFLCVATVAATLPAHATHPSASPEINRFADLVQHRLALMETVAAYKWLNGVAITDAGREERVIAAGKHAAASVGLDPETVEPFIRQQIETAKAVQKALMADWKQAAGPRPTTAPDLATVIRPAISVATSDILRQLGRVLPLLRDTRTQSDLVRDLTERAAGYGVDESNFQRLVEAAASVGYAAHPTESRLDRILRAGLARVETECGYSPFGAKRHGT